MELLPKSWQEINELGPAEADVFASNPFTLPQRRERDDVLRLDPWIEEDGGFDIDDFHPGTVDLFTADGSTWSIPVGAHSMVMFYSQDLFDQRGVLYPQIGWTWDDFLEKARAIRDPETDVYGYAIINKYSDILVFVCQHGGRLLDGWENPTRTTFNDPLTIEALEWSADLIFKHNVSPAPLQTVRAFGPRWGHRFQGIRQSKIGMWIGDLAQRGGLSGPTGYQWDFRWGAAPLPRDAQSATWVAVEAVAISSQAQDPDACWAWLSLLSRQTPHSATPPRRSVVESAAYEEQAGSEVVAVARASLNQVVLSSSPNRVGFEEASEAFWREVDKILQGDTTPEKAMQRAQGASGR